MWKISKYEETKQECERMIKKGIKKPYDYMVEYKKAIKEDNFEKAKAITDVLYPLNYHMNTEEPHKVHLS